MIVHVGTNKVVGPGKYRPETAKDGKKVKASEWSFSKDKRLKYPKRSISVHQTYDNSSTNGKQASSRRTTTPIWSAGRASRDDVAKTSTFRGTMTNPVQSVRMQHRY